MKITIWIRNNSEGEMPRLRLDAKYESYDTPRVQRYGRKLIEAIEGKERHGSATNDN